VKPTRGLVSLNSGTAFISAIFSSAAYVSVRELTRTDPTPRIVFWFSAVATLLGAPLAVPGWRWLSLRANLLLAAAGFIAAPAQTLMTASYRRAPAHVAAAFSYANVPIGYLLGLVFWGEHSDLLALLGILLIIVGGVALVFTLRARSANGSPK